jgi:hypothetical protein
MTAVTGILDPRGTTFTLVCNEEGGDVRFSTSLSVLAHSVRSG